MDRMRKAFWFSLFLTGAGQLYLGQKKKGFLLLLFSLLGILTSCVGVVLALSAFLGLKNSIYYNYKVFFCLGIIFFIGGVLMIVISGCKSVGDITTNNKKQE